MTPEERLSTPTKTFGAKRKPYRERINLPVEIKAAIVRGIVHLEGSDSTRQFFNENPSFGFLDSASKKAISDIRRKLLRLKQDNQEEFESYCNKIIGESPQQSIAVAGLDSETTPLQPRNLANMDSMTEFNQRKGKSV